MKTAKWDIANPIRVKWTGSTSCRYYCEYSGSYLTSVTPDSDGYVELRLEDMLSILHHCTEHNEAIPFDQTVEIQVEDDATN